MKKLTKNNNFISKADNFNKSLIKSLDKVVYYLRKNQLFQFRYLNVINRNKYWKKNMNEMEYEKKKKYYFKFLDI